MPKIGVIGGTGLYEIEGFSVRESVELSTPFGAPSDRYTLGMLGGVEVAFLPRHGAGHRYSPSDVNYRANIFGFKLLGCERLIGVSAVGSMKEDVPPGDLVLPDQFIDRTCGRPRTFFGDGIVAHISFAEPVCRTSLEVLARAAREEGIVHQVNGVYLCIEGPQFSTRAESELFRSWKVDVIGMTNLPEARLAREAEICYATIALATDYDCWHAAVASVNVEDVVRILAENVAKAKRVIARAVPVLAQEKRDCPCADALDGAILTAPERIPRAAKERLRPLIGKYVH